MSEENIIPAPDDPTPDPLRFPLPLRVRFEGRTLDYDLLMARKDKPEGGLENFNGHTGVLLLGDATLGRVRLMRNSLEVLAPGLTLPAAPGEIKLELQVILGTVRLPLENLPDLGEGSILELDKSADEPLEIYMEELFISEGEVVVIEDKYGLRLPNHPNWSGILESVEVFGGPDPREKKETERKTSSKNGRQDTEPLLRGRIEFALFETGLEELTGFNRGQVIVLNKYVNEPVTLRLENGQVFSADVIVLEQKFAIRLRKRSDEGEPHTSSSVAKQATAESLLGELGELARAFLAPFQETADVIQKFTRENIDELKRELNVATGNLFTDSRASSSGFADTNSSLTSLRIDKLTADFTDERLGELLSEEHPQLTAFVLSRLSDERSATLLRTFPRDKQSDYLRRMATLGEVSVSGLDKLNRALLACLKSERNTSRGPDQERRVSRLLARMPAEEQERLLEELKQEDPELTEKLRGGLSLSGEKTGNE